MLRFNRYSRLLAVLLVLAGLAALQSPAIAGGAPVLEQQAYIKGQGDVGNDQFGNPVASDQDTLVIGARFASPGGEVHVYAREPSGDWVLEAVLVGSNTDLNDRFGTAVAISGDTIVVGAPLEASSATGVDGDALDNSAPAAGAAYVFLRTDGAWTQQAYLKASNTETLDTFGDSVDVDGDTIVVGAKSEDSDAGGINGDQLDNSRAGSGAAYVFVRSGNAWTQQAYLKSIDPGLSDWFGFSVAVVDNIIAVGSPNEDSAAVGVDGDPFDGSRGNSGAVFLFERQGESWVELAYLKASNTEVSDRFGYSVAYDGIALAVAAREEDSAAVGVDGDQGDNSAVDAGAVYVFERSPESWIQTAYIKPSNTGAGDFFGHSLEIENERLLVGAEGENSAALGIGGDPFDDSADDAGAAYLFERTASGWGQAAYLKASNTDAGDQFGGSVTLGSTFLAVGAYREDSAATGVDGDPADNSADSAGAVYAFDLLRFVVGGEVAGLQSEGLVLRLNGGQDLPVSSNGRFDFPERLLDGATYSVTVAAQPAEQTCQVIDGSGVVEGATVVTIQVACTTPGLAFEAYLKAINTDPGDRFGDEVAADGEWLIVGAREEDSVAAGVNGDSSDNSANDAGAAYLFRRSAAGAWSPEAYLKASNPEAQDHFGFSVAMSGDTAVVGAWKEDSAAIGVNGDESDNNALDAGAVYVFVRNGAGQWVQQAYLKASNTNAGDQFGHAVAISGDTLVVGAPHEDSFAPGVNGNELDNTLTAAGAAYVFVRSGTAWSQQAYLKASNPGAVDLFGSAVAIDGDTVIVGAHGEDGGARTVNGDGADDSADDSGAAYIFERAGTTWTQQAYLKSGNSDADDRFGTSVAVDGDRVAVGSTGERSRGIGTSSAAVADNSLVIAGAIYTFTRDGSDWAQEAYFKATNTDEADLFGHAVDLSGDRLLVSSLYEASASAGVNGNQADDAFDNAGAAYLYRFSPEGWVAEAYLKAGAPDASDTFGTSVALTSAFVVVGARNEDSAATGVGGNQDDNSATNAGAAYSFALSPAEAFFVGGVVNGLEGPGLVLQNNDGDDLVITANGPFQFAGVLADGEPYSVTVLSSPTTPAQSCSVTNGQGMVQGQDVVDIQVDCVTFYAIGGTIIGAAGSGLVLQNNGGDDLPIAANGPFQFGQLQLPGSTYDVTVLSAPSSPEQLCRVLEGSGTVGQMDVTDIAVRCRLARRIGGTVSGLEGSGLVLELNDETQLPISTNGPFQFPDPMPDGFPYEVTVVGFPQSPEQACMVANGSGTATGGDVTDVEVACETTAETGWVQLRTALIEVNEADGMIMLEVERVGGTDGAIEVAVVSQAGSAIEGVDYLPVNETLNWTDGDAMVRPVIVGLIDDAATETVEDFELVLVPPSYQTPLGDPARATVRIFDDETVLFANGFED